METLFFIISALVGYLLGSINSAIIVSRIKGKDIRTVGSGNAGATNILRTFGKGAAGLVFLIDILKGVAAVLVGRMLAGEYGGYIAGFLAVIGHNFPLYFGFKGGKGIVTSLAVMLTISPTEAFSAMVIAVIIIYVTRYVSLGSIVGAATFALLVVLRQHELWLCIFAVATALLAILRHTGNIKRLCNGTERRLGK